MPNPRSLSMPVRRPFAMGALTTLALLVPGTALAGKRTLMLHPSGDAGTWTTLAWEAPADGTAELDVTVYDPAGHCSEGFDFELRDDADTLLFSQYDTAAGVR